MTHEERARRLVAAEMVLIGFKFEKPFIEAMETRIAAALREVERETLEKAAKRFTPKFPGAILTCEQAQSTLRALAQKEGG